MERVLEAVFYMLVGASALFAILTILGRNGDYIAYYYRVKGEEESLFDWKRASQTNGWCALALTITLAARLAFDMNWLFYLLLLEFVVSWILQRKSRFLRRASEMGHS